MIYSTEKNRKGAKSVYRVVVMMSKAVVEHEDIVAVMGKGKNSAKGTKETY